jgi:hypothetical protein
MKQRCRGSNPDSIPKYKDKGIGLDDPRWEKFENFLADMGERPPGTTLDRRDGWKGYCKRNCRWSTQSEQNRNRGGYNHRVRIGNRTQTISAWAEETGIAWNTIKHRFLRGWRGKRLIEPVHTQ